MRLPPDALSRLVAAVLGRMGGPPDEAALVAGSLVRSNLQGHDSHGVGLTATYARHFRAGLVKPGTAAEQVRSDGAILMFDGGRGFGRRVGGEAVAAAARRCRETGVVLMTLRNAHHLGRIGAYAEIALDDGLASIHFVNVVDHPPSVAPWGGAEARFVTNPVCIAVPGTEGTPPTVLDMATSRIALGKARVAMTRGEEIEAGLVMDAGGRDATDPGVLFAEPRGALLPFGQHKGSGLGLMCELLAGGLSGGGTIHPGRARNGSIVNNMLSILIDPARLADMSWLRGEIDAMIAYVKSSRAVDPAAPVLVAGDAERGSERRRAAGIDIDGAELEEILGAGEELGLARAEMEAMVA